MSSKPYGGGKSSPPRSIPPSLRDTKRNPLGIGFPSTPRLTPFYRSRFSKYVTAITEPRDDSYSNPRPLSSYFELRGRWTMHKDERDLLEVLKSELEFLGHHGYRRSPQTSWSPKANFEDSPMCINFHSAGNPRPCT